MRDYHELVETVNLTHDNASSEIHAACSDNLYFRVKTIQLSVYEESTLGGILEILDTDGNWVWTVNVESVKDRTFEFGYKGMLIGQNMGVQATLSGADTQASVSLCVVGQLSVE